jgi:hypothetical protein
MVEESSVVAAAKWLNFGQNVADFSNRFKLGENWFTFIKGDFIKLKNLFLK